VETSVEALNRELLQMQLSIEDLEASLAAKPAPSRPAPSRPIARGLAGHGLLAHVLISKYYDQLPLHRQSQIFAREGIDLDRSTLAGWIGDASALLEPLISAIGRYEKTRRELGDLLLTKYNEYRSANIPELEGYLTRTYLKTA
jgi:hypothetical protein